MELVNKYIEPWVNKFPLHYKKDGDYYRKVIKRYEIQLNGFKFIFDKVRYFNKDRVYIKTLNIIVLNNKRLEDDDFYVSFTGETKDLINTDKTKYAYGLFSKKLIPQDPIKFLIELKGISVKLRGVRYDPYFYKYSDDFLKKHPYYPYMGISLNPLYFTDNDDICLAAFIFQSYNNKNLVLQENQILENYKYIGSITIPTLYFKNLKEIKEDEELIWNNIKAKQ
jgi:hypothetical protein